MRVVRALLLAVVLLSTGGYFFVYLARWEWQRATVTGLMFLAAQVAAFGFRHRSASTTGGGSGTGGRSATDGPDPRRDVVLEALRRAPAPTSRPFRWLEPRSDRLSVFIPLLLGAGLLVSVLVVVVERVSWLLFRGHVDSGLADDVAPFLPTDDLLSGLTDREMLATPGAWAGRA